MAYTHRHLDLHHPVHWRIVLGKVGYRYKEGECKASLNNFCCGLFKGGNILLYEWSKWLTQHKVWSENNVYLLLFSDQLYFMQKKLCYLDETESH